MSEIIRFDLLEIKKNSQRLCTCDNPHFEIDMSNRMVQCKKCRAYVDSFRALEIICNKMNEYEEYQEKAQKILARLQDDIDRQNRRRLKTRAFKEMEANYLKRDLLPVCPICKNPFDPADINSSRGRKFCNLEAEPPGEGLNNGK